MELNNENIGVHAYTINKKSFDSNILIGKFTIAKKSEQMIYWRKLFASTLLPLIITGAPVHQLFIKQNKHITNTKEWLKSMFCFRIKVSAIIKLLVNSILLVYALVLNLLILLAAIWIFKELLIDGELPLDVVSAILKFGQVIPYIIPVNLIWFLGFKFIELMKSFESNENDLIVGEDVKQRHIIKIVLLYFLLAFIYVIDSIVVFKRDSYCYVNDMVTQNITKNTSNTIGVSIFCYKTPVHTYILDLIVDISYILFFMVYIVFCWALLSKFCSINLYIKNLIGKFIPTNKHFREIKHFYKRAANQVFYVNRSVSFTVSSIMELYVGTILLDVYNLVILILKSRSELKINGELYFVTDEAQRIKVRLITTAIIVIIAKISVLLIVILQILRVNDESKATVVHLNDFVTQFEEDLSAVDYHSFRALKSYIISRMQRQDKRSLLSIRMLEKLAFFRKRIYDYIPQ